MERIDRRAEESRERGRKKLNHKVKVEGALITDWSRDNTAAQARARASTVDDVAVLLEGLRATQRLREVPRQHRLDATRARVTAFSRRASRCGPLDDVIRAKPSWNERVSAVSSNHGFNVSVG